MRRRRIGRKEILVLGGGFAGLAAAQALRSDRFRVTLVDRRRGFEFLPNIHELLSGVKKPDLLRLPLDVIVPRSGHRFLQDTVTAIDPEARSVSTRRRRTPLRYDALIVALGGANATHGVPGVDEFALPFKSVRDCERIGRRLAQLARRRRASRVVVVGGGLEGIEALGEILRRYRESRIEVTVVEARERLLAEAPAPLDAHVRSLSRPFAVDFELGAPVRRIEAEAVVLEGDRILPSDLTIWTGGPAPPALLAESGLAPKGAWAPVDVTLQSRRAPAVFVAGDAADWPEPLAKQGYHALDMGAQAARNAGRWLTGRPLEPFRPSGKPMLISFGDLSGFAVVGGHALSSPSLAAAKEAVFELVMAQLDDRPGWRRWPGALARADVAVRELLWPTLSSWEALRRQTRVSFL